MDAITYDYCLSEPGLRAERESRLREIREIGLTEDFAETPKDWIPKLYKHLEEHYGGVKSYLSAIGFGEASQAKLINVLCVEPGIDVSS